jgi:UPF0716 protein FxsA
MMLAFFDRDFLFKLILALLAWALVPLGEIFLFIFLGSLIGNSLVLILAVVTSVVGALVGFSQARRALVRARAALSRGSHPGSDVVDLAGLLVSSALLVTPGFATDVLGIVLLVPSVRTWAGRNVAGLLRRSMRDVYDTLKLAAL